MSLPLASTQYEHDVATVLLQLLHLTKALPESQPIAFTPTGFCRSIGWPATQHSFERLQHCISQLQRTSLESPYCESISLCPAYSLEHDQTGEKITRYQVEVNPAALEMFASDFSTIQVFQTPKEQK
ncbi:MAG: plasmid replication initiator TrfA [Gallionella sp.]|nr:plasmid replication initiator TrfA [Gallionella sp.]